MRPIVAALTSVAIAIGLTGALLAQQPAAAPPPAAAQPATPKPEPNRQAPPAVKVDIVLSRANGQKTLSSLPYSINVAEGHGASLRLGSQVPIPTSSGGAIQAIQYQSVGSNIDCHLRLLADGRFSLALTIEDSSLADGMDPPVIRSYRISTLLVLRNGEATTFNVATDKVSGDTVRAQVTATALK